MKKKILIVGAGFGQLPAIRKSKEMGLTVVVVDKNLDAPGMSLANFAYNIDIIDFEGVLKIARKHNIDGVMTMQTDLPIPTIGLINDKLKLKGVSYQCAIDCSHKTQTRIKLKEKLISQPDFEIATTYDQVIKGAQRIGFPVIVKAVDSSGSRGVTKVISEAGIVNAFDEALKFSRQKNVLVEEFIDGIEIGAQTFSVNGKCIKVLIHNDTMASGKYMVPIGHSFPTFIEGEELDYALKTIKDCVEALKIHEGPSNIDLIFDKKDGIAKIIEVGARIGATCLPELVEHYTGIDWVEATILNALGEEVNLTETQFIPTAAEILEAPKDGILQDIYVPESVYNHKDLLEIEITVKKGEEVSVLRKGTDRIGKIIVKGDTYIEAEELAQQLKSSIIFKIDTSK